VEGSEGGLEGTGDGGHFKPGVRFEQEHLELSSSNSPALRFLSRSQQLTRLQQHILGKMIADTEAERSALPKKIETKEDVEALVAKVVPRLERSAERWADIPLMYQLFLARHVDNFQSFLEELLGLILKTVPNVLKGTDTVTVVDVLSHASIASFVDALIERKLLAWGYKSLRDLDAAILDLTKFKLFPKEEDLAAVDRLYDGRNLFTHSYGLVNPLYLRKLPDCGVEIGQPLKLDISDLKVAWELLAKMAPEIEDRARRKFKLPA
jgi:hypothetical protein